MVFFSEICSEVQFEFIFFLYFGFVSFRLTFPQRETHILFYFSCVLGWIRPQPVDTLINMCTFEFEHNEPVVCIQPKWVSWLFVGIYVVIPFHSVSFSFSFNSCCLFICIVLGRTMSRFRYFWVLFFYRFGDSVLVTTTNEHVSFRVSWSSDRSEYWYIRWRMVLYVSNGSSHTSPLNRRLLIYGHCISIWFSVKKKIDWNFFSFFGKFHESWWVQWIGSSMLRSYNNP